MKRILFLFYFIISLPILGQEYTTSNIHSHNDYEQSQPFEEAYNNEVGIIEADVFLLNNQLFVAHTSDKIKKENTLEALYLKPLADKLKVSGGKIFAKEKPLLVMIDVKTEAVATLKTILAELQKFPELTQNPQLSFVISGNRPDPVSWIDYPNYISFDGRLNETYTAKILNRVALISEDLKNITVWNGKGVLTQPDRIKVKKVIQKVHDLNKKIRFWSTQDNVNTWITLMNLDVDYIGTDKVVELVNFIKTKKNFSFQNTDFHKSFSPKNDFKQSRPKNVILLIGDGMGLAQLYAGYTANKGELNIFNMPIQGFSITQASDSYITDSAAGATAMATGVKTNNRFIGKDVKGEKLENLSETLSRNNFQTAIISSGNSTDATPAAFYAHQIDRSFNQEIALDFLSNPSDVLIGGGIDEFTKRKDGINIGQILQQRGYAFLNQFADLNKVTKNKFVIIDNASVVSKKEGRGKFLEESFAKVIGVFTAVNKPFFIMEEGAQIDYGGHKNEMDYVVKELLDFDELVGQAMEFVDKNKDTLLLVTADHETGGLSIIDGNIETGYVHGNFSTNDHTAIPVPVFAFGPGAENFKGVYQNTEIYSKIKMLLNIK